jgi:hypothetical protein
MLAFSRTVAISRPFANSLKAGVENHLPAALGMF